VSKYSQADKKVMYFPMRSAVKEESSCLKSDYIVDPNDDGIIRLMPVKESDIVNFKDIWASI
jgi:hypothetical protein